MLLLAGATLLASPASAAPGRHGPSAHAAGKHAPAGHAPGRSAHAARPSRFRCRTGPVRAQAARRSRGKHVFGPRGHRRGQPAVTPARPIAPAQVVAADVVANPVAHPVAHPTAAVPAPAPARRSHAPATRPGRPATDPAPARAVALAADVPARRAAGPAAIRHASHHRAAVRHHSRAISPTVERAPSSVITGLADPVVQPLRRLGHGITAVTGWSVFSGPLGWLFTGVLVLGVAMVAAAFAMGRRRGSKRSAATA